MKRKTLALVLGSALTLSAGTLTTQAAAPDNYNLEIQATLDENGEVCDWSFFKDRKLEDDLFDSLK